MTFIMFLPNQLSLYKLFWIEISSGTFFMCLLFLSFVFGSSFLLPSLVLISFFLQCKSKCTPSWTSALLSRRDRLGSGSHSLTSGPRGWPSMLLLQLPHTPLPGLLRETAASASRTIRAVLPLFTPLPTLLSYPVATFLLPLSCLPTCRLREASPKPPHEMTAPLSNLCLPPPLIRSSLWWGRRIPVLLMKMQKVTPGWPSNAGSSICSPFGGRNCFGFQRRETSV